MINRTYKIIHNKYSVLFNFLFFLRYFFGIFFISIVLFLSIPYFFDYKKQESIIKNYLSQSYGLTINKYEELEYSSLPIPNLKIQNIDLSLKNDQVQIKGSNLTIYPKLLNIYNLKNFKANKIILNNNKILITVSDLKILISYIFTLKNKLTFENLDLKIRRKEKPLLNIAKIKFSNFGYNKNKVMGELFNKKFKILINDNYNKINFKLSKTGLTVDINFDEAKNESSISGIFKSKFLNSNLKFNFDYNDKKLKIYNSYFRNRDLSFSNHSSVIYQPFFSINSFFKIEDINIELFKDINLNEVLKSKNLIKKINIENEIDFKSNRFSNNLIDDLNLHINLAYGRLNYSKRIYISEHFFSCHGEINLLEEYPILFFDCSITTKDKKKLLEEFSIKYKEKNELFKLNVKGNINILNNKINFKNIIMNQDYKASKEDLNYFKQTFENIIFDKGFLNIFNYRKIEDFILEIL